jgi:ubiquinone/menaquinone biosynthesis C-methylase UbiE
MTFPDHFSAQAARYKAYRPTYPDSLFERLASLAPARNLAWDCATGNGQAALGLAPHFQKVVATDASARQLALADAHPRVTYAQALVGRTPLTDGSVDLITVASAFHWLELPVFYAEVQRVARPGCVLAAWGYKTPEVSPEVQLVVDRFDREVLGPFWLPETSAAVEGYGALHFPFEELDVPAFRMTHRLDCAQYLGYLGTWSASLRYLKTHGRNPTDEIREEMIAVWGDPAMKRDVTWPVHTRVGRVAGR